MSDHHGGYTPPPPPPPGGSSGGYGPPPAPPPGRPGTAPPPPPPVGGGPYGSGPPTTPQTFPPPGYAPPTPGPGAPPTPPPPKKAGSSRFGLVLGGIAVLALLAIVVSAIVIVRGNQRDADRRREREEQAAALLADQEDLAAAVADGDGAAVTALLEDRPSLVDADAEPQPTDEVVAVDLGPGPVGSAQVDLDPDVEYSVVLAGDSAGAELVLVGPDGEAVDLGASLTPTAEGVHTLLATAEGTDVVEVSLRPVRTEAYDFEPTTYEIAEPGDIVELTMEIAADELYDVIFTGTGVVGTIFDAEDQVVLELDPADESEIRFSSGSDTTYRLRIEGEDAQATGSAEVDIIALAHWTAFAGEEGDEFYLESETEPAVVEPRLDPARNVLTFCLYLRPGLEFRLDFVPTTAGATWDLDIFDDEAARAAGTPSDTFTNVEAAGIDVAASDVDREPCYDLRPTSDITSGVDVQISAQVP